MPAPTVLIASDALEAEAVRAVVEEIGLRAVIVDRASSLASMLETESPSLLVLSDRLLRGQRDLLARTRAQETVRLPVIVLGALDEDQARSRGADAVVARPLDWERLREKLIACCGGEPANDEARAQDDFGVPTRASTEVIPERAPMVDAVEGPDPWAPMEEMADYETVRFQRTEIPALNDAAVPFPDAAEVTIEDALGDIDLEQLDAEPSLAADLEKGENVVDEAFLPPGPQLTPPPLDLIAADTPLGRLAASVHLTPLPERGPALVSTGESIQDLPTAGDLGELTLGHLMGRIYRTGFTGCLELWRGGDEGVAGREMFFDGGFPVAATSSLPGDSLVELLWRTGRIGREGRARIQQAARSQQEVGEALVAAGIIRHDELPALSRLHAEEIIYSCFAWERCRFRLGPEVAGPGGRVFIAIHPYALVLEGTRRRFSLARLVEVVGPPDVRLEGLASLRSTLAELQLAPAERQAVGRLERGPCTISELGGGIEQRAVYALVHALLMLEAVRPVRRQPALPSHRSADGG